MDIISLVDTLHLRMPNVNNVPNDLLSSSGPIVNVKSKLGPEIGFVMG